MSVDTIYSTITNALDPTLYQLDRAPAGQSLFNAISVGINSVVGAATTNAINQVANTVATLSANSDLMFANFEQVMAERSLEFLKRVSDVRNDFYNRLHEVQSTLNQQQALDRIDVSKTISNLTALLDSELLTVQMALGNANSIVWELSNTTSTRFESTAQTISIIASTIDNNYAFLLNEVSTRTTNEEAIANSISTLAATFGDSISGLITDINNIQVFVDSSVVNSINALSSAVGNNYAFSVSERNLRIANNTSTAAAINSLGTTIGNNYAYLVNEHNERVTAIDGVANNLNSLSLSVGNNYSFLISEQSARIANNVSTINSINNLASSVGNNYAFLTNEENARISGDAGVANSVSALGLSVSNSMAYMIDKVNLAVANTAAMANTTNGLQIQINNVTSSLTAEVNLRTANNVSTGQAISSLGGIVANNYAFLTTEENARITGDAGVAYSVATLGVKVANNYGYLETLNNVVVGTDGVTSKHAVTIDTNGYITGYQLIGGGGTSSFIVNAADFQVTQPGASTPFTLQVESGVVKINGDLIVTGTVNTVHITDNAISNNLYYSYGDQTIQVAPGQAWGSWVQIINQMVYGTTGGGFLATFNCTLDGTSSPNATATFVIRVASNPSGGVEQVFGFKLTGSGVDMYVKVPISLSISGNGSDYVQVYAFAGSDDSMMGGVNNWGHTLTNYIRNNTLTVSNLKK